MNVCYDTNIKQLACQFKNLPKMLQKSKRIPQTQGFQYRKKREKCQNNGQVKLGIANFEITKLSLLEFFYYKYVSFISEYSCVNALNGYICVSFVSIRLYNQKL